MKFQRVGRDWTAPGAAPLLAADIGGTNITLAVFDHGVLQLTAHFESQAIGNFVEFVAEILGHLRHHYSLSIQAIALAVAGPVSKDKNFCKLTNLHWAIDIEAIQKRTGLRNVLLLNDFEAIAYGIDAIDQTHLVEVKRGVVEKNATRALLGAGTGLGKSTLIFDEGVGTYRPIMSELGHANASLSTRDDFHLAQFIQHNENREMVSWQDVLSGRGLKNIYRFLQSTNPSGSHRSEEIRNADFDPSLISKYKYEDALSARTFQMFTRYYARCAKIIAMDALAFGGVFVAGGIAAKNMDIFTEEEFGFHQEFLDVKKLKEVLESIPIYVIRSSSVGLYGAAVVAKAIA